MNANSALISLTLFGCATFYLLSTSSLCKPTTTRIQALAATITTTLDDAHLILCHTSRTILDEAMQCARGTLVAYQYILDAYRAQRLPTYKSLSFTSASLHPVLAPDALLVSIPNFFASYHPVDQPTTAAPRVRLDSPPVHHPQTEPPAPSCSRGSSHPVHSTSPVLQRPSLFPPPPQSLRTSQTPCRTTLPAPPSPQPSGTVPVPVSLVQRDHAMHTAHDALDCALPNIHTTPRCPSCPARRPQLPLAPLRAPRHQARQAAQGAPYASARRVHTTRPAPARIAPCSEPPTASIRATRDSTTALPVHTTQAAHDNRRASSPNSHMTHTNPPRPSQRPDLPRQTRRASRERTSAAPEPPSHATPEARHPSSDAHTAPSSLSRPAPHARCAVPVPGDAPDPHGRPSPRDGRPPTDAPPNTAPAITRSLRPAAVPLIPIPPFALPSRNPFSFQEMRVWTGAFVGWIAEYTSRVDVPFTPSSIPLLSQLLYQVVSHLNLAPAFPNLLYLFQAPDDLSPHTLTACLRKYSYFADIIQDVMKAAQDMGIKRNHRILADADIPALLRQAARRYAARRPRLQAPEIRTPLRPALPPPLATRARPNPNPCPPKPVSGPSRRRLLLKPWSIAPPTAP
ncbi:hypothetical protein AURDEDRAFT_177675 [Auricularia subglabra TFB-10046 SS5]|uniref:Uncharacterized protein n=1 Tax=Auricularia subglabra (strain TFB-10046 / SS5) TaxID=717982 RepID=J0WN33_AURST|nr:hypothetical protein AURDEDRAFT_177675 [Auricularia subglabra TFB-10046 SS5]